MTRPLDRIDRLFRFNARSVGHDVHLILPDHSTQSYAQSFDRASRIARAIAEAGVRRGERVLAFMSNSRELIELYIACSLTSTICVPVNVLTTSRELIDTAADCTPAAVFFLAVFADRVTPELLQHPFRLKVVAQGELAGWQDYEALLQSTQPIAKSVNPEPEEPIVMIYSSGTTGKPKGILLRERAVVENAHMTNLHMRYRQTDVFVTMLPLFSSFGFCWDFLMPGQVGAKTVILPRYDPATVADLVERHRITTLIGVPTMFARFFDAENLERRDISSLRLIDVGGGPVSDRLKHDLKHVHRIEVVESYGLTEISPVASVQIPFTRHKVGSCGPALPGIEVRVVDEEGNVLPPDTPGELCFRCSTFMVGYWNKREETARVLRNGWLHSGDIGAVDEDGHIYYRDRLKDMIVANGYNVYPKEVENALAAHDAVQSAAVVGLPHEIRGDDIHGFVVLKSGALATERELIEHCAALIGKHKLPRGITFVAHLPLTASGKIQRFQLRALAGRT